jgi:hypothetical protein
MKLLIAVIMAALAAAVVTQTLRVSRLNAQNDALRQQLQAAEAQVAEVSNRPAQAVAPAPSEEDRSELLRLRNQAVQLKQATNELQKLRAQVQQLQAASQQAAAAPAPAAPNPSAPGATGPVSRESWAFAGYATPEATLQSAIFAMSQGDYQTFLAAMTPEEAARMQQSSQGKTPEQIAEEGKRETGRIKSFQVLGREELAPDRVMLQVYADGGDSKVQRVMLQKIGDEWKWAGRAGAAQQAPAGVPAAPPVPQ